MGYNLGSNAYKNTAAAEKEYDAEAHWMAVQCDALTYSIYFGPLEALNQSRGIPLIKCEDGVVGHCLVKDKRHYFDFSFFENAKVDRIT